MDAPQWMFTKALSHRQKVLRLFKRCLRECDNWYQPDPLETRFHKVVVRARFDEHKDEKDTRVAQKLLTEGCHELWTKHNWFPREYPWNAYGIANERLPLPDDSYLDQWPHVEKEQYPYYFNRREAMKKDLLKHWDKIEQSWDERLEALQKEPPKEQETVASK